MHLVSIATRDKSRGKMEMPGVCDITTHSGLARDFRSEKASGKKGKLRQITVLSLDAWKKVCKELDADLGWVTRRANLLVCGIEFSSDNVDDFLQIGSQVTLQITGETKPCVRMDELHPGLQAALKPEW